VRIEDRPTEMLERQLSANRSAARYRNLENGRRHFAHVSPFRPHFVREIVLMRQVLKSRANHPANTEKP
jgi:hypothetical protein